MVRSNLLGLLVVVVALCAMSEVVQATDVVLSHQGRLLDSGDQPINGTRTITFRIFDVPSGGVPLWSEVHTNVQISAGLFDVTLGSVTALSADVLAPAGSAPERYLSLQIEPDTQELSPRRRLTATPAAAVATRVTGDIVTNTGELKIKPGSLSSANIVLTGDDDGDLFRVEAKPDSVKIRIRNHTGGGDPDFDLLRIVGGSGSSGGTQVHGGAISMTGDPDFDLLRVAATQDSAKIGISGKISGDPDFDLLRISGGTGAGSKGAAIRISGDPDFDLLRIQGSSSSGPGGVSGTSGISITGDPDFDLLRMSADKDSAKIRISGQSSGDPDFDLLRIAGGTGPGTTGASMTITGDPDFDLLRMSAGQDSAKIRLGGKITGDPDFDLLRLTGGSGAAQLAMQSEPSGVGARSHSLGATCDSSRAGLTLASRVGMSVTQLHAQVRMAASSDSALSALEYDSDNDGYIDSRCSASSSNQASQVAVSSRFANGPRQTTSMEGTFSHAHLRCDSDSDGDGVQDNSVICESSVAGASLRVLSLNGLPPGEPVIGTLSMTTTPNSASLDLGDLDGDGLYRLLATSDSVVKEITIIDNGPGGTTLMKAKEKANRTKCSSNLRCQSPSIVNEVETACDESSSRMLMAGATSIVGSSGASHASMQASPSGSGVSIDKGDVIVGMETKDEPGGYSGGFYIRIESLKTPAVKVALGSDGIGYLSSGLGVGVVAPTHFIDVVGGAYCDGTNWVNASDRNSKENFEKVDGAKLLEKLSHLEITKWNYKGDDNTEHIGPTAQDFKKAFGVGADDKSISTIDPSGIALAAIKELYAQLMQKDSEIAQLRKANAQQIDELRKELAKLQQSVKK